MATIRKRGSSFHVQIRRQGHPNITKSFSDRQNALQWSRKIESAVEREVYIDSSMAQQTTLGDALNRYSLEVLPTKRAGKSEQSRIVLLQAKLGHHKLSAIRSHVVAQYRDERLQAVKPSTVKRELGLLSRVLNTAIKEWGIALPQGHAVRQIRIPKEAKGRERRLQVDEEQRLLDGLVFTPLVKTIVEFALETATRRGEIVSMDWKYVDLDKQTLHIPKTKTDTPRTIPLSRRAVEILRSQQGQAIPISGFVWKIEPHSITQAFNRACERTKITDLRFHDLRHEATSRLFERGLSIMEVATITGHRDLRMLQRYTHLKAEQIAKKLG